LDGTNQQASVVEVFKKRTSQTTPTEPHKNFAKKKIEEIQQGKSKSEKKKLSCQKDDAEKIGQKIWEKDHNFNV